MTYIFVLVFSFIFPAIFSASQLVEIKNSSQFESFAQGKSWIVEFYAPWCGHCQNLVPVLERVSDYAKDSVVIGKVDATKVRDVADKFDVSRYPTLFFKHHNSIDKYHGGRDFVSLSRFVDNLESPPITEVSGETDIFPALDSSGFNVTFVFGIPQKCSNPGRCAVSYEDVTELAETLKFHHSIMRWKNYNEAEISICKYGRTVDGDTVERLYCSKSIDVSSIESMQQFIQLNNYPLISELEAHNFKVLAHLNKTMVIGVIDFKDKLSLRTVKNALSNVAKFHIESDPTSVIFGYLDGVRWKKFARHHEAVVPSILIADHDNERHGVVTLKNYKHSEYDQMFSNVVRDIKLGTIEMKSTIITPSLLQKFIHRVERYGWLSFLLFASPILFLLMSRFFPHPKDKKDKQH